MTNLPPKHILSKSTFMRGCQCPKSLWLHKYQPELKDEMSEQQASIFGMGTNIGELARDLFPGGVDASPDTAYNYQWSVAKTAEYIEAGHEIIYEAAFQFNGVLAALDILVKRRGRWYGYEVKSSTKVKAAFIQDVALQYYVITNAGLALSDIALIYVNNKYRRKGSLDLEQLFCRQSLLKEAKELQKSIAETAAELTEIVFAAQVPQIATGKHCRIPYACDFYGHCWKDVAEEINEEIEQIN
ncbi:MAG: Dna2/Cas4 domain-containing protein, partial [Flavisolibacter sp.]|nr:Dna2/Cas4 domain-containing protein [Flavisolibacter sp.]